MNVSDSAYFIQGKKYDRVTHVINAIRQPYRNVPKQDLETARVRGTQIHFYVDFINKGLQFETPVHLIQHVKEYHSWFEKHVVKVIGSEMPVYSTRYNYAGRCDVIAQMKGFMRPALIDIKTCGFILDEHRMQTAVYREAAKENRYDVLKRIVLYIDKDTGEVKQKEFTDHQLDFNAFLNCLNLHRYFNSLKQ